MAPAVDGPITWLSVFSSSLQISIVSALFIIIYVTLYSLCASCYSISDSGSTRYWDRREKTTTPSAAPQNELPELQSAAYTPSATDLADHTYSILEAEPNEENPYECIREPDRDEGEAKSPSPVMTKPDDNHSISAFTKPVNMRLTSAHRQSKQHQTDTEPTAVYASVNWKTKSQKNITPLIYTHTEVDMSGTVGEDVPPIPDKHF